MGVLREVTCILDRRKRCIHLLGPLTPPGFGKYIIPAAPDEMTALFPVQERVIVECLRCCIAIVVAVERDGQRTNIILKIRINLEKQLFNKLQHLQIAPHFTMTENYFSFLFK